MVVTRVDDDVVVVARNPGRYFAIPVAAAAAAAPGQASSVGIVVVVVEVVAVVARVRSVVVAIVAAVVAEVAVDARVVVVVAAEVAGVGLAELVAYGQIRLVGTIAVQVGWISVVIVQSGAASIDSGMCMNCCCSEV